jgi:uncharacterized protein
MPLPSGPRAAQRQTPTLVDGDRAEILDALRAFALLGILISHVPDFTGYNSLPEPQRALLDPLNLGAPLHTLLVLLIRDKFVSLFSLLFGIGFAVQLHSSLRRETSFHKLFGRRLAALFLIGAVHASIWYGDILKDYALLGSALLLTARWSERRVRFVAALLLFARLVWPAIVFWIFAAVGHSSTAVPPAQAFNNGITSIGQDPSAFFRQNLGLVEIKAEQMIYEGRFITILAMFFLGAWIGKNKLYLNLEQHRPLLLRALGVSLPIGVLAEAALVPFQYATNAFPPTRDWVIVQSLTAVAAPSLCIAYASGFALAWLALEGRFLRWFAPVGRMALTSYVSQTLLCTVLFVWLGFGRGFGAIDCLATALIIVTAQSLLARWWLRHLRFGPLEWIWRCATYAKVIDIQRAQRMPRRPLDAQAD